VKKMPCVFVRTFNGPRDATITREVTPSAQWVIDGEGQAFIKRDGTACAVIGGVLHKRYDAKRGKAPPAGAIPCCEPDEITGHHPHWVPVDANNPADKWHALAMTSFLRGGLTLGDATYELCGPHFNGNPEGYVGDFFVRHDSEPLDDVPRDFDGLRDFIERLPHEGIVFHHPDGRMAKIRRVDFGFPRVRSA